jgi:hypothetical protein
VPEVALGHARRADEELADVQLELLAEEVVGESDVPWMVDQLGEDRIAFDYILAAKGLAGLKLQIGSGNTVEGVGVACDLLGRQRVLEEDDAVPFEGFPLVARESGWSGGALSLLRYRRRHKILPSGDNLTFFANPCQPGLPFGALTF